MSALISAVYTKSSGFSSGVFAPVWEVLTETPVSCNRSQLDFTCFPAPLLRREPVRDSIVQILASDF